MTQRFLKYSSLAVAVCAMSLSSAAALSASINDLPEDSRIKILRYNPNDIYTLYTLYGYQTNVEFAKNEMIQTISVGDRSLWQIVPAGYRLFIRPMDDNVQTNMTVITDRRTYQFDIKSGEGDISANPRMVYVARFDYPQKEPKVASQKATTPVTPVVPVIPVEPIRPMVTMPPAEPIKTVDPHAAVPPAPQPPATFMADPNLPVVADKVVNYNYTFTGPDGLAPLQLFDDGVATYMRLPQNAAPKPKLYAVEGGQQVPLMYRPAGELVKVDSVHATMVLDYAGTEQSRIYLFNEERLPAGM